MAISASETTLIGVSPMHLPPLPRLMNGKSYSSLIVDDQGKIWLNGEQVFTHTKAFSAVIDNYTIPVTLKSGKNSILVKVCEEVGGWGFYLRITDTDGKPFDDLKINQIKETGFAQ